MSELKATTAQEIVRNEKDCDYMDELFGGVKMPHTQVYIKSEADKYIGELEEKHKMEVEQLLLEIVQIKRAARTLRKKMNYWKRKFCKAMAKWCDSENYTATWYHENTKRCEWTEKWYERWLKLAEKFKE